MIDLRFRSLHFHPREHPGGVKRCARHFNFSSSNPSDLLQSCAHSAFPAMLSCLRAGARPGSSSSTVAHRLGCVAFIRHRSLSSSSHSLPANHREDASLSLSSFPSSSSFSSSSPSSSSSSSSPPPYRHRAFTDATDAALFAAAVHAARNRVWAHAWAAYCDAKRVQEQQQHQHQHQQQQQQQISTIGQNSPLSASAPSISTFNALIRGLSVRL
jgi:hypothetical protein